MTGIFLPVAMIAAAILTAIATYRGIRRGGARFYTLEREAILRRASLNLGLTTLFFLAAVSLLMLDRQQALQAEAAAGGVVIEGVETSTPQPVLEQFPPTPSPTATVDASIPTVTPTPIICRAVVAGTFDNGLTLRETPGGADIAVLPEASLVNLIPDAEKTEANGFTWRKVRSVVTGEEGWVAEDFLQLGPGCE